MSVKIAEYKFNNTSYDLIPEFNEGFEYIYEDIVEEGVTTRTIYSDSLPTKISFEGKSALLELEFLEIGALTSLSTMFYYCMNLTSIDVSNWDTSQVTDMSYMFCGCHSLTSLDVSNFDTSNVEYICNIFQYCRALTTLDVSNWNTSNVIDMSYMFYGCNQLTSLDVSNFNTSNVEYICNIFQNCQSLTTLNVSNFDTSNMTDMSYMFKNCSNLTELNISNWHLNSEVDVTDIFTSTNVLNNVTMNNSDYSSVNKIIASLPTRATDSPGILNIAGIDDVNQIDIDTAESKYWNILTMYLSEDVLNINVNQTKSIHAISDKDVVWESDNENILIKDNNITNLEQIVLYGNLCSVEYSNCELTQTYNSFNVISYSSSSVTVKIRINNLDPNEIYTFSMGYLSGTTVEIYYGDNYQGGSTSKTYTITGSDSCTLVYYRNSGTTELWGINNLLLVDSNGNDNSSMLNGKILYVTGVTEGSSIITCTTVDGYETYKCIVNISNIDKNNIGASRGLISWRHSDFLYKTDLIVDTMKALNLNVLHQQFTHKDFEDLSTLATSINNFRNNMNYDIEISAIIGDPSYYLPEKIDRILARIDNVINLNNDTDAHIDSIFIDIEPWVISDIEVEDWLDDYKNNMQQAYNYCKENGLKFILCVPFWLDSSADIKNYNANYYKEIIDICDELVVMNFNRSGQINNIKEEIEYCKLTNKRICSIAECQYFSDEQDAKLSYFNGDPQVVNSDWLNLYNAFDYDNIGFIFHCFHDGIIDWINVGKVEDVYNPYVVEYTFNKTIDTLPTVNDDFIYTYIDIDNNDDTITRLIVSENPLTKIRFESCEGLLSLESLNISDLTTFRKLFYECVNLQNIENISCYNTIDITDMSYLFYNCESLTTIDMSNWDTSNVTKMNNMFYGCSNLTSLDLSNFDTSKVIDMVCMFYDCQSLTTLDVSNFNTSNVTDMRGMFYDCQSLTSLDVSNFDTSNVTDMTGMFNECRSLTSLDVSNFNTSKVTSTSEMFYNCVNLTSLDVSKWDTSNVVTMSYMFASCSGLTTLDVSKWDTSNVMNTYAMFDSCVSLTSLDLSGWNTINMINMNSMFSGCTSLNLLNLSNWVLDEVDIGYLCSRCTCLTTMILNNWNFNKPSWISNIFNGCINLNLVYMENSNVQSINNIIDLLPTRASDSMGALNIARVDDISQVNITTAESKYWNVRFLVAKYTANASGVVPTFNSGYVYDVIETVNEGIYTVELYAENDFTSCSFRDKLNLLTVDYLKVTNKVNSMANSFRNCQAVTSINTDNWDTSNVTSFSNSIRDCIALTDIDVSNWDVSKVTTMRFMFYQCYKLTSLDTSRWNTESLTDLTRVFFNCEKLTTIGDVSNWNVSKVTDTSAMFQLCYALTELNVSNWDTSGVVNMGYMFSYCNNLTTLDVSNWDTSNVTNMVGIFAFCQSLTSLDVSNWDTSNITNMVGIFRDCIAMTSIDLSTWNTENMTDISLAFYNSYNLTQLNISNLNLNNVNNADSLFTNCNKLNDVSMNNSDYNSVNKIITSLPTRTTDNEGTLNITGIDDISQVNITTAESKYWNILNLKQYKVHLIPINNNKVNKVYSLNKKIKISFYK